LKRFIIEIDNIVVDAVDIAPMHGEQFRVLAEEALVRQLKIAGAPSELAAKESITIGAPEAGGHASPAQLAIQVGRAIHQSLTRKA
jgi:hypothetical protein